MVVLMLLVLRLGNFVWVIFCSCFWVMEVILFLFGLLDFFFILVVLWMSIEVGGVLRIKVKLWFLNIEIFIGIIILGLLVVLVLYFL